MNKNSKNKNEMLKKKKRISELLKDSNIEEIEKSKIRGGRSDNSVETHWPTQVK